MGAQSPIETIQTLGKYALLEKIGEGYLGSVYRGFDQDLGQAVAVRVLCDGIKWDAKIEEMYNCQCRSVAGLRHAGIASVLNFGTEGRAHYIVQESLGNSNLKSLISRQQAMTVEAKLSIMIQVAEALSHAHTRGILHRDLGPAKIHLMADAKAKVRDFAIASILMKHLPHPWIRYGTPIYLSPEQIQQIECDQRSDIFSIGTIFYEFLTYHHPFHDRDGNKALDNILHDTPVPTFDLFPEEPPGIWPILKTCLARDPGDRYQSMDEFSDACRYLLKDLADDSRLMLSELYAALTPLRKAAAMPDAPPNSTELLHSIEKLLGGEKEMDYVSLDRLMNALIAQYPAVQAVSGSLPDAETARPVDEPDTINSESRESPGLDARYHPTCIPAPPASDPSLAAASGPDASEPGPWLPPEFSASQAAIVDTPDDRNPSENLFPDQWNLSSETQLVFETAFSKTDDGKFFGSGLRVEEICQDNQPDFGGKTESGETAGEHFKVHAPNSTSQPAPQAPEYGDKMAPVGIPIPNSAAAGTNGGADSGIDAQLQPAKISGLATCYRRIRRPSYRTTVVLLSILLIAAAAYIVLGTDLAASLTGALKARMPDSGALANAVSRMNAHKLSGTPGASETTAAEVTSDKPASAMHNPIPQPLPAIADNTDTVIQPPKEILSRISGLINSGKLLPAKAELDKLQRSYPAAPQIRQLRRHLDSKNPANSLEKTRKEEEKFNALAQREEEWSRKIETLLARGQYGEISSVLNIWLAEDPGNAAAREIGARAGEIQRNLNIYASAVAENRYQEALNAISNAEKLNPADSNFAELRRQTEARKAAAKSLLTIYRLGPKATILLDGRPIGTEGELENESISAGSHTITVESGGNPILSRQQELIEGQRITLVYDAARQYLRSMAESDRELLAQRKSMEEVRYFDVEHEHGAFRGVCRGLLMIDYLDVAFRPSAGFHGFRIPFKLLKLSVKGRSVELINVSDDKSFQKFKVHDTQTAEKLKRSWDELKSYTR